MEFVEKQLFELKLDEFPPLDIHHLKSDNPFMALITLSGRKKGAIC